MKDRNKVIIALQKFGWSLETSQKWLESFNFVLQAYPNELIRAGKTEEILYFLASKRK